MCNLVMHPVVPIIQSVNVECNFKPISVIVYQIFPNSRLREKIGGDFLFKNVVIIQTSHFFSHDEVNPSV